MENFSWDLTPIDFGSYLDQHEEANKYLSAANMIGDVYLWVVLVIGVPGNILTIFTVVTLATLRPSTLLIALLAFVDCLAIIVKFVCYQLYSNDVSLNTFLCKFDFVPIALTSLASWLLLLICMERFLTVRNVRPHMLTNNLCLVVTGCVALAIFLSYGTLGIVMRDASADKYACVTIEDYAWFWVNVWYKVNAACYLFVPIAIMVPLVSMMFYYVKIRRYSYAVKRDDSEMGVKRNGRSTKIEEEKARNGNSADNAISVNSTSDYQDKNNTTGDAEPILDIQKPTEGNDSNKEEDAELAQRFQMESRELTIMATGAMVVFVLLALPAVIYFFSPRPTGMVSSAKWHLVGHIQRLCVDATHAINFFLYFVFSALFRRNLISFLLRRRHLSTREDPVA